MVDGHGEQGPLLSNYCAVECTTVPVRWVDRTLETTQVSVDCTARTDDHYLNRGNTFGLLPEGMLEIQRKANVCICSTIKFVDTKDVMKTCIETQTRRTFTLRKFGILPRGQQEMSESAEVLNIEEYPILSFPARSQLSSLSSTGRKRSSIWQIR